MKSRIVKFFLIVFNVTCILAIVIIFAPWKSWLGKRIETTLTQYGFEQPALSVDRVTSYALYLSDISAGTGHSLTLKNLYARYTPDTLMYGKLQELMLDDLQVSIVQNDAGWQVQGINFKSAGEPALASGIPLTREMMDMLPFDTLGIAQSRLVVTGKGWEATVPFSLAVTDKVSAIVENAAFKHGKNKIDMAGFKMNAQLQDKGGWAGTWQVKDVSVSSLPAFDGDGTFTLDSEMLSGSGQVHAKDESGLKGRFKFAYNFAKPKDATITLENISMPWGEGTLSTKNVSVPLWAKENLILPVYISKVSVDDVMKLMTGEYVRATGTLSGKLPVIVGRDGSISLGSGALAADKKGRLSLPPDVIPGQGTQIEMTRDILKNFQYNDLSVDVTDEGDDNVSVLLALKGSNPDIYNGRAVHLNVRLGGDVLDFIRSNVMMLTQPETLLDQEQQ